jgi:DNA-binding NarL/FixJ family response regulator
MMRRHESSSSLLEIAANEYERSGDGAGDELSATESAIAQLVASGSSNKEVATALHLSAKTVEWNLSKIYRKLGVRSRTDLARLDL